ncbi:MAG TPA: DUF2878 domain-containing protein [Steroidobacteraceae bacterium]|nr:DUF2878 domain-containing protein [Steroidobacteraceae bacterium]
MNVLRNVANLVVYQCAWFACVLSAAANRPVIGIAVACTAVLLHLYAARSPGRELPLIAVAILAGAAFESLLMATGWVRSPVLLIGSVTPLWMVSLWAAFATTLNVSLRALRRRYLVTAVIAAVGAPLAYQAGAAFGALQWVQAGPALLLVACGWALLLPLLMRTAQHFDGFAAP